MPCYRQKYLSDNQLEPSYRKFVFTIDIKTWRVISMCKLLMLYLTQPYASNKIYIGKYGKIWSFGSKKRNFSHFYGKEKNLQTELKVCCSQWLKVPRSEKKKMCDADVQLTDTRVNITLYQIRFSSLHSR